MGSIGAAELIVIALIGLFTLTVPAAIIVLVIFLVKRSNKLRGG